MQGRQVRMMMPSGQKLCGITPIPTGTSNLDIWILKHHKKLMVNDSMVPVLAVGWADVKKRQQLQENLASVHQERIKEIAAALAHTRQTSLSSSIRLANLQARQSQLVHRLIHLAAQTPQHVPIIQSTVFKQEEADMAKQLEGVKAELEGHGRNSVKRVEARGEVSRGRLLGQVNELWGQLEEIRRKRKVRGPDGREQWIGDEKMLGEIAEVSLSSRDRKQFTLKLWLAGFGDSANGVTKAVGSCAGRESGCGRDAEPWQRAMIRIILVYIGCVAIRSFQS